MTNKDHTHDPASANRAGENNHDASAPTTGKHPMHQRGNTERERRADDSWRQEMGERMDALERQIVENTTITQAIKANTDEIVEFFQAGKGFFTVVRAVGSVARWIAIIAAASGIAYGIVKFGLGQLLADLGVTKK